MPFRAVPPKATEDDLLATRSRERAEAQRAAEAERKLQASSHELELARQKLSGDQGALQEMMQASERKLTEEREAVAAASEGKRAAEAKVRELEGELLAATSQVEAASRGAGEEVGAVRAELASKTSQLAALTEKLKASVAESRALEDKMGAAELELLKKQVTGCSRPAAVQLSLQLTSVGQPASQTPNAMRDLLRALPA
eukprot:SAG22_NODE_246_length_13948_cov_12.055744_9_plen_200_part_00